MVLLQISYAFQQCKTFENQLRFDKATDVLKVGTFLRHSVEYSCCLYEAMMQKLHLMSAAMNLLSF